MPSRSCLTHNLEAPILPAESQHHVPYQDHQGLAGFSSLNVFIGGHAWLMPYSPDTPMSAMAQCFHMHLQLNCAIIQCHCEAPLDIAEDSASSQIYILKHIRWTVGDNNTGNFNAGANNTGDSHLLWYMGLSADHQYDGCRSQAPGAVAQ